MELVVALAIGLLGGGTVATVVGTVVHARADNARTVAEGHKLEADAFDVLVGQLQTEIARLDIALAASRDREAAALTEVARLRDATADATGAVRLARDEVTRLQDRLDALTARRGQRP